MSNLVLGGLVAGGGGSLAPQLVVYEDFFGFPGLFIRDGESPQALYVANHWASSTEYEHFAITWFNGKVFLADDSTEGTVDVDVLASGVLSLRGFGGLALPSLPTENPNVAGRLWNDGGTLKVSAGT